MSEAKNEGVTAVEVNGLVRLMVKVTLYDADMNEHVIGPMAVEIPAQTGTCPWDQLHNEEQAAKAYFEADMECHVDFDSPNTQAQSAADENGERE